MCARPDIDDEKTSTDIYSLDLRNKFGTLYNQHKTNPGRELFGTYDMRRQGLTDRCTCYSSLYRSHRQDKDSPDNCKRCVLTLNFVFNLSRLFVALIIVREAILRLNLKTLKLM